MKKRRVSRIKNLVAVSALAGIVLIVTSFAWFIGMQTVNVASFDVEIASAENLLLSLDGKKWDTTVSISKSSIEEVSYENHTNWWAGRGLIPMSTVGEIDMAASRLILFEKASITATIDGSAAGYRLMASRVPNYEEDDPERDGYVAFDLFVRNFTGAEYYETLNVLNEEAIYLTVDSSVDISLDGGVEDTGIENSVRVAFAQIGRVKGTTVDDGLITGITCNANAQGVPQTSGGVTGICRTAQIWEPNDTIHVANAISWYDTSCLKRSALAMVAASYSGKCNTVEDGTAYSTYAVKQAISSEDQIDVYDGAAYNGFVPSAKLFAYPYFKDSHKILAGTNRPAFMTLAPNSITKVRVYIFLEGQDIDNYDFASIGKKISVKFGFTKQRFIGEDIDYGETDPSLAPLTDVTKPVIKLNGDAIVNHTKGTPYEDAGATATDDIDGDITSSIRVDNPVNVDEVGEYIISYNVRDWAGNNAVTLTRTVIVEE